MSSLNSSSLPHQFESTHQHAGILKRTRMCTSAGDLLEQYTSNAMIAQQTRNEWLDGQLADSTIHLSQITTNPCSELCTDLGLLDSANLSHNWNNYTINGSNKYSVQVRDGGGEIYFVCFHCRVLTDTVPLLYLPPSKSRGPRWTTTVSIKLVSQAEYSTAPVLEVWVLSSR